MSDHVRPATDGAEIVVWVVPGAQRTELVGVHGEALRIRVAQPPERGRANRAIEDLLGGLLGVRVELVAGASSRRKRFLVRGIEAAEVRTRLGE